MRATMTNLDLAARDALDDAVTLLDGLGYVARLEETYRKAAEPAAKNSGKVPRLWSDADRSRIRFEALLYLSALLLEQELPAHMTRRKLLFGRGPDRAKIDLFRAAYLRYLPEKMESLGLGAMEYPAMGRLPAHRVSAPDRLREYERLMKTGRGEKSYVELLGRTMDPGRTTISDIVALESVHTLVDVIRDALARHLGAASGRP